METRTRTVAIHSTHHVPQMIFTEGQNQDASIPPTIQITTDASSAVPVRETSTTVNVKLSGPRFSQADGFMPAAMARISAAGPSFGRALRNFQPMIVA